MSNMLWLVLLYAVIPTLVTSGVVSLIAGGLDALFTQSGEQFLLTAIPVLIGALSGGAIASAAWYAFIGINIYVLNNLAYRGQGLGYALLFVPVLAVVGSVVGGLTVLFLKKSRR
ncbi:hypothetical protein H6G89_32970 [Oscillatoria sp. FACHB-1407]|uniref:hypothetical protein n=1 Tax=Oscillatoria sp. FACHB-1407 TaxID=2692847 RepID=UPI001687B639|nr:hypothetical protein [Oscillatoria sp. FACHB-1407]MBD2465802.1 hypothetical protein [Oscillatoria sp. FACHB-1407]